LPEYFPDVDPDAAEEEEGHTGLSQPLEDAKIESKATQPDQATSSDAAKDDKKE
jgi:hypothetical protein